MLPKEGGEKCQSMAWSAFAFRKAHDCYVPIVREAIFIPTATAPFPPTGRRSSYSSVWLVKIP